MMGSSKTKPALLNRLWLQWQIQDRSQRRKFWIVVAVGTLLFLWTEPVRKRQSVPHKPWLANEDPPWRVNHHADVDADLQKQKVARDFEVLSDFEASRKKLAGPAAFAQQKRRGPPRRVGAMDMTSIDLNGPVGGNNISNGETTLSREEALSRKPQSKQEADAEKQAGYSKHAFNQYVSDRISLHRVLGDKRSQACRDMIYPVEKYPTVSLVIVFHEEARSTLLRTVWSALDNSPESMLIEIILVDDASKMEHLQKPLEDEIATIPRTRLLRLKERSGLIRARIAGIKECKGEIFVVLDSHCECNVGWLEPLVDRIYRNRTTVVTPVIDSIDQHTWKYLGGPETTTRGVFSWSLVFTWLDLPPDMAAKRKSPIDPLPSPTMAGGLFAMDREYFWEIGSYDMDMDIWGGENLEISFRIWMCGGTLENIPCSRVGHVFRDHHPYRFPNGFRTIKKNTNRVAEVWLDEYKHIYYEIEPAARSVPAGDVSKRIELREKLHCKSFEWYLANVFPDMFVPLKENVVAGGLLRNPDRGLCVRGGNQQVTMRPCSARDPPTINTRFYFVKKSLEIRYETSQGAKCLDSSNSSPLAKVEFWGCHGLGGNQKWEYIAGNRIKHTVGQKCLEIHGQDLVVNKCTTGTDPKQEFVFTKWAWSGSDGPPIDMSKSV